MFEQRKEHTAKILLRKFWRDFAILQSKMANPPARRVRHHIKMNMYYVYILLNEAKTRTYTGVADDINKRLAEHNAGRVKSSRPYRPYQIAHTEPFETLSKARQRERFYKLTTGRRKLKEMLFKA